MDRLFRSNSTVSSSSRTTSLPTIPDIVNEEDHSYQEINQDFRDWTIPKISTREIYKSTFLNFRSDYNIKTVEKTYGINKNHERCQLFNKESLRQHRTSGYNFIHIGLVQVALKPLNIKGINASVLLCLRDARFLDFTTSLMGVMESGLHDGPVHFNCFPDFTLSLSDPHILKALTLNIKTAGQITNIHGGSHALVLIYRVYYISIKTNLNFHVLIKSPKDQTLLIQSNT